MRRRSPPESGATGVSIPRGKRVSAGAAEQAVEHGAKRGVGRPLVVGARADERVADRREPSSSSSWPSSATPQRRRARHRAGVRLLGAGDQPQQRRLAVAVAPDDADPVAGGDAERDVASTVRLP